MLEVNNKVPLDIAVKNQQNEEVTLKDYVGQYLVIYFYPRNNTPGCTKEAISFRDMHDEFSNLGVKVIGVNKDSVESHVKFSKKYDLTFELLSDQPGVLLDAFGAIKQKNMFGKSFVGIVRSTFIIDPDGTIIKIFQEVKVEDHTQIILDFLKKTIKK